MDTSEKFDNKSQDLEWLNCWNENTDSSIAAITINGYLLAIASRRGSAANLQSNIIILLAKVKLAH